MTTRTEKARRVYWRERKEWETRVEEARKKVDACPDMDTMQEAARDYMLAKADAEEFRKRSSPWVRVYRVQANSEYFRRALAGYKMAARFYKEAERVTGLTESERKTLQAQHEAEMSAFTASINLIMRQHAPR